MPPRDVGSLMAQVTCQVVGSASRLGGRRGRWAVRHRQEGWGCRRTRRWRLGCRRGGWRRCLASRWGRRLVRGGFEGLPQGLIAKKCCDQHVAEVLAGDTRLRVIALRVAMVAQWLRASRNAGQSRRATQIYTCGIAIVQVLWVLMVTLSGAAASVALIVLIAASSPCRSSRRSGT
jgi:hypothetical protein